VQCTPLFARLSLRFFGLICINAGRGRMAIMVSGR